MQDLLILCYHAVSPSWPAALSVTPDALERQLTELKRRGYRSAGFTDAIANPERGPVVAVTFDDNYRSVLELAKPILDHHGYCATLFVPTDWPGEDHPMRWPGIDRWLGTPHEEELLSLTWEELRELSEQGWEIGSHTCSHPHLPELETAVLKRELTESKQRIEQELGRACTSLAYPYGGVDQRVRDAAAGAGYQAAGTIPRVLTAPEPLRWPRTPIFQGDDLRRFRLKVSPAVRRLRGSPLGTTLDRARVAIAERVQARAAKPPPAA
jgi:peptidoglycan/xylan/chitin deacetylase (PgdA/CDA1 family)